ncbi:MAG: hypothetical protein PHD01_02005 [Geobacteraceae bacterium]|nr:hypothetical protein [Geobacteraceae bacterium]
MDGMTIIIVFAGTLGLFAGAMMIRDLLARKAGIERMSAFIVVMFGSAGILILSFRAGYKLHSAAWIVFVGVFGWLTHRFVGSSNL